MNVDKEWPTRKYHRIAGKNYSHNGAYFLTICTKDRHELFGEINGDEMVLSEIGKIVQAHLCDIEQVYTSVVMDSFVIMPNHVHMLLHLINNETNPSVSRVIQQWKGAISKQAKAPLWQEKFHDRVVDTADEYRTIQQYIRENPMRWEDDVLRPLAESA